MRIEKPVNKRVLFLGVFVILGLVGVMVWLLLPSQNQFELTKDNTGKKGIEQESAIETSPEKVDDSESRSIVVQLDDSTSDEVVDCEQAFEVVKYSKSLERTFGHSIDDLNLYNLNTGSPRIVMPNGKGAWTARGGQLQDVPLEQLEVLASSGDDHIAMAMASDKRFNKALTELQGFELGEVALSVSLAKASLDQSIYWAKETTSRGKPYAMSILKSSMAHFDHEITGRLGVLSERISEQEAELLLEFNRYIEKQYIEVDLLYNLTMERNRTLESFDYSPTYLDSEVSLRQLDDIKEQARDFFAASKIEYGTDYKLDELVHIEDVRNLTPEELEAFKAKADTFTSVNPKYETIENVSQVVSPSDNDIYNQRLASGKLYAKECQLYSETKEF